MLPPLPQGYLIVKGGDACPVANAIMFGLVSGIMVYISIKDLLPTALKYDPENQVSSNSFLLGGVVMAVSLILLGIRDV
jgi:zinc transporter, ZIP family